MPEYKVDTFSTGFFSGTLNPKKLESQLNKQAAEGWQLARTIHETRRIFLFFKRETHFLVLVRGG